jgi:hypothetical protein
MNTDDVGLRTLPAICREHGFALDTARVAIRSTPELRAMGDYIGGSRVYRPQEVSRLVAALQARRERRKKAATST